MAPRPSIFHSMWDPPRPGIEPVSPALAGGLLSHQGSPRSSFSFGLLLKKSAGNKAGSKKDMVSNVLYISV